MKRLEEQLVEIAHRKAALRRRMAGQRDAMAAGWRRLQGPASVVDRGLDAVRLLRGHPLLLGGAIAALVIFRRRGLLSTAGRLLTAWRLWRSVAALAARGLS